MLSVRLLIKYLSKCRYSMEVRVGYVDKSMKVICSRNASIVEHQKSEVHRLHHECVSKRERAETKESVSVKIKKGWLVYVQDCWK